MRADSALRAHPRVHWDPSGFEPREKRRIVSLVPSLSEALVVLGLSDRLIGVTRYCVHPAHAFEGLAQVGGTKDADVEAIVALDPDLVIANQEENTERIVRQLAEQDVDVWVTHPETVREGAALLRELAGLGATPEAILRVVTPVERAVDAALERVERARNEPHAPRPRVFCPIWRDPWMTIARGTYIHDMIELCGGENPFAEPDANRRDRRYPIVRLEDVERAEPDIILLPDEPYAFAETDRQELASLDCPAARDARIHLIDGTLVSWYGPRIAEAIRVLAEIFATP